MIKKLISLFLSVVTLLGVVGAYVSTHVTAAEDSTPPELVNIEILTPEIDAGQQINVSITVRESETGLAQATI